MLIHEWLRRIPACIVLVHITRYKLEMMRVLLLPALEGLCSMSAHSHESESSSKLMIWIRSSFAGRRDQTRKDRWLTTWYLSMREHGVRPDVGGATYTSSLH